MINAWSYLEEYKKEKKAILGAVERVFESGRLILSVEGEKFEREFADFCGCKYGVGVNSGTDALFISLKAMGVGIGDEVITVPNTAVPTVSAIIMAGARPVFVDVRNDTLLMDASKIENKISKKTKVILPVHLFGLTCEMEKILAVARKYNLKVLEDCAQNTGVKPVGDAAGFSFYPTKVLGGYGDGGMILTNNKKLAEFAKGFRQYEFNGINSRMDEIQAAILRFKLKNIEKYIEKRREIAKRYNEGLKGTGLILPKWQVGAVWYMFPVRHKKRQKLIDFMAKNGVSLGGFKTWSGESEVFSLPIYPELTTKDQEKVIRLIRRFF